MAHQKEFSTLRHEVRYYAPRLSSFRVTLRQLERDGLVNRTVYPSVPIRVEYELTSLGRTLINPLATLAKWAEKHQESILSARANYDDQNYATTEQ